ncbi:aldo/keto reductase [Timonella sp. A28]|uniref:aldo/keto reductase n=1 Tax=Timonella sp. A28 TaxID=3442640 RepID=UPI003EB740FE
MTSSSAQRFLTAHTGFSVPSIGLGTYKLNGSFGTAAILQAAEVGYRYFDSAVNYGNEDAVGLAVQQMVERGIAPREELIVASKLPGRDHEYESALHSIEESLYRSGLEYLDVYLIHWPNPIVDKYVEAWAALIEAQKRGYVRHIGVSNFEPQHIDRLERETSVVPVINQVEMHPYFPQSDLLEYNTSRGIITQAWSPLVRAGELLGSEVIHRVARTWGITPAQVVLRWHVQRGVMPIPKATSLQRQQENLDVFDVLLSEDDMNAIATLAHNNGRMKGQDPTVYQEF